VPHMSLAQITSMATAGTEYMVAADRHSDRDSSDPRARKILVARSMTTMPSGNNAPLHTRRYRTLAKPVAIHQDRSPGAS